MRYGSAGNLVAAAGANLRLRHKRKVSPGGASEIARCRVALQGAAVSRPPSQKGCLESAPPWLAAFSTHVRGWRSPRRPNFRDTSSVSHAFLRADFLKLDQHPRPRLAKFLMLRWPRRAGGKCQAGRRGDLLVTNLTNVSASRHSDLPFTVGKDVG